VLLLLFLEKYKYNLKKIFFFKYKIIDIDINIMSTYKILTDKDDIILKKKDNKFKLETKKKVKPQCNIIKLAEDFEIYNLFKLLNEKLISKFKIIKNNSDSNLNKTADILLCLKNILKDDESDDSDENFYISFTNSVLKKNDNSIILTGKKNHISLDKEGWKKIDIDDITLTINLIEDELEINLNFEYIGEKLPIYAENTIGLIFRKIIKNLVLYYSNSILKT